MGGKAAGQARPELSDMAQPWEAARSVTLILSRSKFPQGTARNLTLVGEAGVLGQLAPFKSRARRGKAPVPSSRDTRPGRGLDTHKHTYSSLGPHPSLR